MKPTMLTATLLAISLAAQAVAGSQPSSNSEVTSVGLFPGVQPDMLSLGLDDWYLRVASGIDDRGPAAQRFAEAAGPEPEAMPGRPAPSGGEPQSTLFQAIYTFGGQVFPAWSPDHRQQLHDSGADFKRSTAAVTGPVFLF